jgi:hypothetical protein
MNARHLLIVLLISITGGFLAAAAAEPLSWVEHEAGGLSFPLPVFWETESGETIRVSDPSHPEWAVTMHIDQSSGASDEIRLLSALHQRMLADGYAEPDGIPSGTLISSGMYQAAMTDRFGQVHRYYVRQIGSCLVSLVAVSSLSRSADELDRISRKILGGISSRENRQEQKIPGEPGYSPAEGMNISITEDEAVFQLSGTVSGSPLPPVLRC